MQNIFVARVAYPSTFHNREPAKSALLPSKRVLNGPDVADRALVAPRAENGTAKISNQSTFSQCVVGFCGSCWVLPFDLGRVENSSNAGHPRCSGCTQKESSFQLHIYSHFSRRFRWVRCQHLRASATRKKPPAQNPPALQLLFSCLLRGPIAEESCRDKGECTHICCGEFG